MQECGECTLCCTVLGVDELFKPPGEECRHLDNKKRCLDYEERPKTCKEFDCAWRLEFMVGDELRPDKIGVVVWARQWVAGYESVAQIHAMRKADFNKNIVKDLCTGFRRQGIAVVLVPSSGEDRLLLPPVPGT